MNDQGISIAKESSLESISNKTPEVLTETGRLSLEEQNSEARDYLLSTVGTAVEPWGHSFNTTISHEFCPTLEARQ